MGQWLTMMKMMLQHLTTGDHEIFGMGLSQPTRALKHWLTWPSSPKKHTCCVAQLFHPSLTPITMVFNSNWNGSTIRNRLIKTMSSVIRMQILQKYYEQTLTWGRCATVILGVAITRSPGTSNAALRFLISWTIIFVDSRGMFFLFFPAIHEDMISVNLLNQLVAEASLLWNYTVYFRELNPNNLKAVKYLTKRQSTVPTVHLNDITAESSAS